MAKDETGRLENNYEQLKELTDEQLQDIKYGPQHGAYNKSCAEQILIERRIKRLEEATKTEAQDPNYYRDTLGKAVTQFPRRGWTVLEGLLPELVGKPWDDKALGCVQMLRPSYIRVTQGTVKLDARVWRVTVYLEEDNITINRIDQEVEVGLAQSFRNGHEVTCYLNSKPEKPINIGDLVSYRKNRGMLHCGSGWYDEAVVVSLDPFILISTGGDMKWQSTIKIEDFVHVGKADTEELRNAIDRLTRDNLELSKQLEQQ